MFYLPTVGSIYDTNIWPFGKEMVEGGIRMPDRISHLPRLHYPQMARAGKVPYDVLCLLVESDHVWGAHRPRPHPVGFGISDKLSVTEIELQASLQLLTNVGSQADVHGPIHDVRVRDCGSARPNAVQKIPYVVQGPLCAGCVVRQHFFIFTHQPRR